MLWRSFLPMEFGLIPHTIRNRVSIWLQQCPELLVGKVLRDKRAVFQVRREDVSFERSRCTLPILARALDVLVIPGEVVAFVYRAQP